MDDSRHAPRGDWQLPAGVSRGSWDYVTRESIATEYDVYHANQGVLRVDDQLLTTWIGPATGPDEWAIDLGCGTGRTLFALAGLGYHTLGIDLSPAMLREVQRKARQSRQAVHVVRANIVCLEGLADRSAAVVTCLFSTLGMVRGNAHRRNVLAHTARILRPNGSLLLHVHNRWNALRDPGGPAWLFKTWWQGLGDPDAACGDRVYPYRGLPNMYLHIYSWRELGDDLRSAGLQIERHLALNQSASGPLERPGWLAGVRASGWLVLARRR
jgi:SAM-dependent methyltransferase